MPNDVLVVENDNAPSQLTVTAMLADADGSRCQRRTWDSFRPDDLIHTRPKVIVIVAIPAAAPTRFFQWLNENPIAIPLLAVVPEVSEPNLLIQMLHSVDDFLLWPVRRHELEYRLQRLVKPLFSEGESCQRALSEQAALAQLVGNSPSFLDSVQKVSLIAASDAPVLLSGETGTGKELFARAIHHLSERRNGPFVPVECSTIPETLVETELFGHTRGAFTDAHKDRRGLAAVAKAGTLFLDEVDSLPLGAQAKLLRFLQEGTFRALGAEHAVEANVRIVAATNHDLKQEVDERRFRLDLYFRLNVLNLQLPPLRQRSGDIEILAHHFLGLLCGNASRKTLSPAALRMLEHYHWPGNVRELFSTLQRAFVFCDGPLILAQHLAVPVTTLSEVTASEHFRAARARALETFERTYVAAVLEKHHGNITHAAQSAGKDRRTFGRLVKKYSLKHE
jgi:DNA-binding NtrC family response regulator